MKLFTIFLGSKIGTMQEETHIITGLFDKINRIFEKEKIENHFKVHIKNDNDLLTRDVVNDELVKNDLIIYLINQKSDTQLKEELLCAQTISQKYGSPKLIVLFRTLVDGETRDDETVDILQTIFKKNFIYDNFKDGDDLVLVILKIIEKYLIKLNISFINNRLNIFGNELV